MSIKKKMTTDEIIKEYKKGRRDFSNIECKWANLINLTFNKVSFRNSDLSYSSFENSTLKDCDFSGTNLEWSSFSSARLIRVNFQNAKISWSKFNDAYFEKVDLRKANLDWAIALNTNIMSQADLRGVNLATFAKDISEIKQEGIERAHAEANKLKSKMPFDVWMKIKFSVNNTADKFRILMQDMKQSIGSYAKNIGGILGVYGRAEKSEREYVKEGMPYKHDSHPEYKRKIKEYEK